MSKLTPCTAESLQFNPFQMIGSQWMAVTTEKDGKANAMTASWGGLGVLWGKNVATIYVRDSRFTKEYLDAGDTFSLAILSESRKADLSYLGKVSGRDEDKLQKIGYHVAHEAGTPYLEEADLVFLCRKLSATPLSEDQFLDPKIMGKWYADGDMHTMYIGEIVGVLRAETD